MKITKGRLKEIIKEEIELLEQSQVDEELAKDIAVIVLHDKETLNLVKSGEITLAGAIKQASELYYREKVKEISDQLMNPSQINLVASLLKKEKL